MNRFISVLFMSALLVSCEAQQERKVGGPCEGCEALVEFPTRKLNDVDTLPAFKGTKPKLHLFGTVYETDGVTPAEGVIIYIYHTNRAGIYEKRVDSKGWESRHGIYRGWVKTNKSGTFDFYTFRPASYPNSTIAQHIHMTVKEPNTIPYYIDAVEFKDDPFLTEEQISRSSNRDGSGIVEPLQKEMIEVRRDIILGMNITDY